YIYRVELQIAGPESSVPFLDRAQKLIQIRNGIVVEKGSGCPVPVERAGGVCSGSSELIHAKAVHDRLFGSWNVQFFVFPFHDGRGGRLQSLSYVDLVCTAEECLQRS